MPIQLVILTPQPAPGQEVTYLPPTGVLDTIIAIRFTLATGPATGSRRVHIQVVASGTTTILLDLPARSTQASNATHNYQVYNPGFQPSETHPEIHIPIPELTLTSSILIKTSTEGLQPADYFKPVAILISRQPAT